MKQQTTFRKIAALSFAILTLSVFSTVQAATPVNMSIQPGLTYTENFNDIANWTNNFAAGIGASAWGSVGINATGTVPDGVRTPQSTATFVSGTSGGVQRGTGNIVQLSTGATSNLNANAIEIFLDFTGVNAGTLTFDWATVFNSTGDRPSSTRVYTSTDGVTYTELVAAAVMNKANNVAAGATISAVALPASFNGSATARIRFYEYNGTLTGSTGSRAKISIDNVSVTAVTIGGSTATFADIAQPSGNILQGAANVVLAGFSVTASSSSDFTALTVTGAGTATASDLNTVRIFRDFGNDGLINGSDSSVSGAGVTYSTSMGFTLTGQTGITTIRNYLIVADVDAAASIVNDSVRVSIATGAYTTTATTNIGTATGNYRNIVTNVILEPGTASSLTFGCGDTASVVINFTGGNGARRIVVVRAGAAVSFTPTDTVPPSGVSSIFTSAADQGSGNKIVYDGTGNTVTVTGLTAGTVYHAAIFEYNGTGSTVNYLTSAFGSGSTSTTGPLVYSVTGSTYQQNFDSLQILANNSVTGNRGPFYLSSNPFCAGYVNGWQIGNPSGSTPNTLFNVGNGSSTTGAAYNFGTTLSTDRAIGTTASGGNISNFGVVIKNTTSDILTRVTISFVGEQWRRGSGAANTLFFAYSHGTSIATGTFVANSSLNFQAPISTTPNDIALDGNNDSNRVFKTATFDLDSNWLPGENLVLRWTDINETGSDDGLGIDSVSFTAVAPAAPLAQDSTITFSGISTIAMTANWLNGDGANRIVKINKTNSFTNPVNGTGYSANPVYGGSGEQVVYNGSGTSVAVSGLMADSTYYFRVYSYNGSGITSAYNTNTAFDNPNSQITNPPSGATQLAITSVNGSAVPTNVVANRPFYVVVESQDGGNNAQPVGANTVVDLTKISGLNNLIGNTTGMILQGFSTDTIFGVIYDAPDQGVQLEATATSGDALTAGQSSFFDVLDSADHLQFAGVPVTALANSNLAAFTVNTLRVDNSIDVNYTGSITISKQSGPGNISGTLTQPAVAGVATFSDIQFDAAGTYVMQAVAPPLASATSGNVYITGVPKLTELVVPKFIGSKTAPAANIARTAIAICVRLDSLAPFQLYDIRAGLEADTATATSYGAGNIGTANSFTTATQVLASAFTADATGSSGPLWIFIQPTGSATRFEAGQLHNLRLGFALSGGIIPTTPNFVGSKTIRALDIAVTARTSATTDDGAFLKGSTVSCIHGKYILIYDNTAGTGDPLFAYQARPANDTSLNQFLVDLPTSINDIYRQAGTSSLGDWPAVIPIGANNPNGVQRVEARNADNTIFNSATDADGIWPGGANTTTIARRAVGSVTLTDAGMNTVFITSISSTPTSCGVDDGTATVTATGNGSLSYLWSNSETTSAISGLASGTYTVTVTDAASGCTASASVLVSQQPISTITPAGPIAFCNGDSVTLSAGAGADHYSWSSNPLTDTMQTVVIKTAGTYTVTVTVGSCVQTSLPVVVAVNNFALNGIIFYENMGDTLVPGNTTVNTWNKWLNGAPVVFSSTPDSAQSDVRNTTTSTIPGASAGNNVFFGTAAGINSRNFIISGINTLGYTSDSLSFGLLRSDVTNGMSVDTSTDGINFGPLTFTQPAVANTWTQIKMGGIPTAANVRIRFSKNSSASFRLDDVTVTGVTTTVQIAANGPVSFCDSGSVILTSNLLTGNVWSTSATTKSITVNSTGSYFVTATDGNGCQASSSPINVLIDPSPVVAVSSTPASCVNLSDGSATAVATGSGTLTYLWSDGQTTATATSLASGTYTVTVTSSLIGCTTTKSIFVGKPTFSDIVSSGPTTFCIGGSVTLSAGGGTSYLWSTSSTMQSIVVNTSGTFTVTVDSAGCIQTSAPVTVTVNDFEMNGIIYSESLDSVSGSPNVGNYTNWQNGAPIVYTSTSSTSSDVRGTTPSTGYSGASGLGNVFMGTSTGSTDRNYIISGINTLGYSGMMLTFGLKRDNGTADSVITVEVSADGISYSPLTITQPDNLLWKLDTAVGSIPVTDNLRIRFSKNNGNQYRIDDVKLTGTTDTVLVAIGGPTTICGTGGVRLTSNSRLGNLWSPNNETTQSILALTTGTYSVTSTGSTGCPQTSAPVSITVNPNPVVTIDSSFNENCYGDSIGAIYASASGGTGTLSYAWNSTPVQTTLAATNLPGGTFTITVTDVNGCFAKDSATITQPAILTVDAAVSDSVVCQADSISLSSTGSTSFNRVYSDIDTVIIPDNSSAGVTSSIVVSGLDITSLTSGQISNVRINSLTHTFDSDLIIRLVGPDGRYLTLSNQRGGSGDNFTNTVFSSSAGVDISTGNPPFSGTFKPDTAVTANAAFSTFNGLNPNGTWQLFVSDNATGETGSINSWSITFNNPTLFSWTSTPAGFTSSAKNPGKVVPSSLGLGTVTYHVTTTNNTTGCSVSDSVSVFVHPTPSATASSTNLLCYNDSNGTASVIVTGGTPPYAFSWNSTPVQTTQTATDLKAGSYTVTVTDTNGCSVKADTSVSQPTQLVVTASVLSQIGCFGGQATVDITASGGTPGYIGTNLIAEVAGVHVYTVTDANGCSASDSVDISQPDLLVVDSIVTTNVTCNGGSDGTATAYLSGGTAPYSILWNNGYTATAYLAPTKDNSIYEANQSNSNGAGVYIVSGQTGGATNNRGLIAFDIAGNIPAGATIIGASLNLNMSLTSPSAGPQVFELFNMLEDWGEGTSNAGSPGLGAPGTTNDATWLTAFYPGSLWSTPGGTFNPSVSGSQIVDGVGVYSWTSLAMIADVQNWLDNASTNYGWMLKGAETAPLQAKRFDSRENTGSSSITGLYVTYTVGNQGTLNTVTNLPAGSYIITVVDANGCTATDTTDITEPAAVVVSSFPASGCPGDSITITGSGLTGATDVQFNGTTTGFVVEDDNTIRALIPLTATTGTITVFAGTCSGTSAGVFVVSCGIVLDVKAYIQGYFDNMTGFMKPVMSNQLVPGALVNQVDTITVELHDTTTGSWALVDSYIGVIDDAGNISCTFSGGAVSGAEYYIAIKHRNSIETWSSAGVQAASSFSYDFTTAAGQAFGGNLKLDAGVYVIYNGDVNLDEVCDGSDYGTMQADVLGVAGGYNQNDVNGDGVVDGSDYASVQPNVLSVTQKQIPQ